MIQFKTEVNASQTEEKELLQLLAGACAIQLA
jgi:hypothetical protein